jgi:hypothetical protein
MANRGRKKSGPLPPPAESSLLGDLESIRTLLEHDTEQEPADEEGTDVPLLEDVVDGSLEVDESPLESRREFAAEAQGASALGDDTIKLLLGDQWRTAAEGIIRSAREAMAVVDAEWSDQQTAALAEILNDRIDTTLSDWMQEVTLRHVDDLRVQLLAAISQAVTEITDELQNSPDHGGRRKRGK